MIKMMNSKIIITYQKEKTKGLKKEIIYKDLADGYEPSSLTEDE